MTTSKQLDDFEKVPKINLFDIIAQPARLDLSGLKLPRFTNPIEEEYNARIVKQLFQRVRTMGTPTTVLPSKRAEELSAADCIVTLDSMAMLEDRPKYLLSLSRNPRSRQDRPIFKLDFDPQAQIKDVP